jgi:hypothetical protein
MPILKRRLDICGREKEWEYRVEFAGREYLVKARQVGSDDPTFDCSCGISAQGHQADNLFYGEEEDRPCSHISEAQRDLLIARQAAAQMVP